MIKATQLKGHTLSDIANALNKTLSDSDQRKVLKTLEWIKIKKDDKKAQEAYDEMEDNREKHETFLRAMKKKYGHDWMVKASTEELEEGTKRLKAYLKSRDKMLR